MGSRYVTLKCPRCGNEQRDAHQLRKVCCECRSNEERFIGRTMKGRAWITVTRALKSGKLQRQPCEVCGKEKVDAHHDDYAKPLDVRWLCRTHHKLHHASIGPGLNAAEPTSPQEI